MTPQEFEQRLDTLGLKKTDFVEISKVNKGTVYNWGTSRKIKNKHGVEEINTIAIPDWVEPFLDYYEKGNKYEQLKKLLK